MRNLLFCLLLFIVFISFSLPKSSDRQTRIENKKYLTENVIIIVVDGPRYTETWGEPTRKYMPNLSTLSKNGVFYTNFYNNGKTYTNAGHTAITTGNYQKIDNTGAELPAKSSIFQHFISQKKLNPTDAWIIASKHKLEVLSNTTEAEWKNKFRPAYNCGKKIKTGFCGLKNKKVYREDSITFNQVIKIFNQHQPKLLLINFQEPDTSGHANNWEAYLKGIRDTDAYVLKIWEFIEKHPSYKGKTTLFVTNDHGRHMDGHKDGFVSHEDDCEGCRHIGLFAMGPDFKKNQTIHTNREQIDLSATIAELLQFEFPSKGKIMKELFE